MCWHEQTAEVAKLRLDNENLSADLAQLVQEKQQLQLMLAEAVCAMCGVQGICLKAHVVCFGSNHLQSRNKKWRLSRASWRTPRARF